MFYPKFLFVKKGAMSKVWLAACQRKLSKMQVVETDLLDSVAGVKNPAAPLALRLSGQLLLGIVRIYQRKVRYLQEDASEALTKIKMVFRPAVVDLPENQRVAAHSAITLPESLDDLELEFLPVDLDAAIDEEALAAFEFEDAMAVDSPQKDIDLEIEDVNAPPEHDIPIDDPLNNLDMGVPDIQMDLKGLDEEHEKVLGVDKQDTDFLEPQMDDLFDLDIDGMAAGDKASPSKKKDDDVVLNQENQDTEFKEPDMDVDMLDLDLGDAADEQKGKEDDEEDEEKKKKKKKRKRKRKFEKVDKETELSTSDIKKQLKDTSDIVTERPQLPSKRVKLSSTKDVQTMLQGPFAAQGFSNALHNAMVNGLPFEDDENNDQKEDEQAADQEDLELPLDDEIPLDLELPEDLDLREEEEELPPDVDILGQEDVDQQEQAEEEDDAKANESGWSVRTRKMYSFLKGEFPKDADDISFNSILKRKPRQAAAALFYELLVLKSHGFIEVTQGKAFGDIVIAKTKLFENPLPAQMAADDN